MPRHFRMRLFVGIALLAAVPPAIAHAHGRISPQLVQAGTTSRFEIVVPNISVNVPLTGFRLTPPADVSIDAIEPLAGFDTSYEGRTAVWSGGRVPPGENGSFAFEARLPASGSQVTFDAEETDAVVGRTGLFPLQVTLVGGSSPSGGVGAEVVLVLAAGGLLVFLALVLIARRRVG